MLIKNIMLPAKDLTLISLTHTAGETLSIIDSKALLSLPVVDNKTFIGVISKRYILEQYFESNLSKDEFLKLPISKFMKTNINCISPDALIEEAMKMLCEHNVQFLPVIDSREHFLGIVTHKAIFSTFNKALGIGHTRLAITMPDLPGRLAKLAELVAKEKVNILSIVELNPEIMDITEIVIRVDINDPRQLVKTLNNNGFTVRSVN